MTALTARIVAAHGTLEDRSTTQGSRVTNTRECACGHPFPWATREETHVAHAAHIVEVTVEEVLAAATESIDAELLTECPDDSNDAAYNRGIGDALAALAGLTSAGDADSGPTGSLPAS